MSYLDIKQAILGAATGYKPIMIEIFCNSLQSTGFKGKLVLFIYEEQQIDYNVFFKTKNYSFEVELIHTNIGKFLSSKRNKKVKKLIKDIFAILACVNHGLRVKFLKILSFPHVSRFFEYKLYLDNNKDLNHFILTDTRDVIFQVDPMTFTQGKLCLGMENKKVSIGSDNFHIEWISQVYGMDYLNEISKEQISCAGVTIGDRNSIDNYLSVMVDEFIRLPFKVMIKSNYDQGIHNKLLYSNQFKNVYLCEPQQSIISTIGIIPKNEISLNEYGEILNKDGTVSPIVHQYDRHPDIEYIIRKKFTQEI